MCVFASLRELEAHVEAEEQHDTIKGENGWCWKGQSDQREASAGGQETVADACVAECGRPEPGPQPGDLGWDQGQSIFRSERTRGYMHSCWV